METWLWSQVNPAALTQTMLILVLVGGAVWLKWPEIKKRISDGPLKEHQMQETDKTLEGKINAIEGKVRELDGKLLGVEQKLANDFASINILKRENDQMRKLAESSLEERQLLMECNLALLKSVRELGANGPTGVKEAEEKLQDYLNSVAHKI